MKPTFLLRALAYTVQCYYFEFIVHFPEAPNDLATRLDITVSEAVSLFQL